MVNIKYFGLPILIGLFSHVLAVTLTCSINIKDGTCTYKNCDDGYYFKENKLVKVDTNNCNIISNPLPGYYKGGDTYIECTKTGCNMNTIPNKTGCDVDGKLINKNGAYVLCTKINKLSADGKSIENNNYAEIPFTDEGEVDYLVHHAGEVFNIDSSVNDVYYVVKSSANSIVLNLKYNKEYYCADKNGKLMDRKYDFCSKESSGMYYTCEEGKCSSVSQLNDNGKEFYGGTGIITEIENYKYDCSCKGGKASNCTSTDDNGYYFDSDKGKLYKYFSKCEEQTTVTQGYFWNSNKYNDIVMCTKTTCSKAALVKDIENVNGYSCNYPGRIVDTGFNLVLCDEYSKTTLIEDDKTYFVKGRADGPFDIAANYYAIKKGGTSLVIDTTNTGITKDFGSKSYICTDGVCTLRCNPSDSGTFEVCKEDGYYVEKEALYECSKSNGKISCISKAGSIGYFKDHSGEDIIKCYYDTDGSIKCGKIESDDKLASDATACVAGKFIIDNTNKIKKLCVNTDIKEAIEIFKSNVSNKYFISAKDLDKSNTSGFYSISIREKTILPAAKSTSEDGIYWDIDSLIMCTKSESLCSGPKVEGYYITKNNEFVSCSKSGTTITCSKPSVIDGIKNGYYINQASEDTKKLIKCAKTTSSGSTGSVTPTSTCTVDTADKLGYYLDGSESTKMIYCNADNCKEEEAENGFFYNKNYDSYIKCSGTPVTCAEGESKSCTTTTKDATTGKNVSVTKHYEITYDNGLKFCNGTTNAISITSTTGTKYYVATGVTGTINYPVVSIVDTSKDKIVIKVDKYSTTQFVDANAAICISNNVIKDPCTKGDEQYQCTAATSKCKVDTVDTCVPNDKGKMKNCSSGYYYVKVEDKMQLYECKINGCSIIEEPVGYYVNSYSDSSVKYVKCTTDGATPSPNYNCIGLDAPTSNTCIEAGDLIKVNGSVKLCIDKVKSIDVFKADSADTSYLPEQIFNKSKKDINIYNVIEISPKIIKIAETTEDGNYLYNGKVMKCKNEDKICEQSILGGYYLSKDKKLISCTNGNCEIKSIYGYFVNTVAVDNQDYSDKIIKCDSNECGYESPLSTPADCAADKLIKVTEGSGKNTVTKFKYCVDDDEDNAFEVFTSGIDKKYYIKANTFNFDAQQSKYYVLSFSEKAITPEKIGESGNYLNSESGKVMVCVKDAMECEMTSQEGYYFNKEDEKKIIKCSGTTTGSSGNTCTSESLMGYFKKAILNNAAPYIKCTDSKCEEINITERSCSSNGNVINNEGNVQICVNSSTKVDIFKNTDDPDDRFFIPAKMLNSTITDNKKYYIIKVDSYSAQKVETSNNDYGHYKYTNPATGQKVIGQNLNKQTKEPIKNECPADNGNIKGYSSLVEYTRNDDDNDDTYSIE